jgi:hypothetical protein
MILARFVCREGSIKSRTEAYYNQYKFEQTGPTNNAGTDRDNQKIKSGTQLEHISALGFQRKEFRSVLFEKRTCAFHFRNVWE